MNKWKWIVAGGVVFGASLLAHLPARLVVPKVSGELQFEGISGSVWRGGVRQVSLSGTLLPIGGLDWSVKPLSLFTGKVRADFREQQTPSNRGRAAWGLLSRKVELSEMHWQLSAESMRAWIGMPGLVVQGRFELDLQSLALPPGASFPSQLEGRLEWQDAVLRAGSEYLTVGAPAVALSVEGETIAGLVTNTQPTLPGDGSFRCTMQSCQVSLNLQPTADAPQPVLNALSMIGLQRSGNTYSGQITVPLQ